MVKNISKENDKKGMEFWHLNNRMFSCEADAHKAVNVFNKKLKYHTLKYSVEVQNYYGQKGRPFKNKTPVKQEWKISGSLTINPEAVNEAQSRKGFFIIATNEMNKDKLSKQQLLDVYKSQGVSVERGFRFLKDPMFYAESLYLKLPKRIMALIMVMGLSLLVYSLAEKKLRGVLARNELTVKDQKRRPTSRPTIRWVFQKFEDVLILYIFESSKLKQIQCELTEDQITIIKCLGKQAEKMYFFDQ
jgi:transposase